jgi:hypothetical protein
MDEKTECRHESTAPGKYRVIKTDAENVRKVTRIAGHACVRNKKQKDCEGSAAHDRAQWPGSRVQEGTCAAADDRIELDHPLSGANRSSVSSTVLPLASSRPWRRATAYLSRRQVWDAPPWHEPSPEL